MGKPTNSGDTVDRVVASRGGLVAWAFYDWASNAYAAIVLTFIFAAYFTQQVAEDATQGGVMWGLALGAAGVLVACGAPVLGAAVDQRGRRKPWMAGFTLLAVTATALLWFVRPEPQYVWLALGLVALGEIGMEYSGVLYNAMLPTIASPDRVGRWSGWGWAMGYLGGLGCLIVALLAFIWEDVAWVPLDREQFHHVRATFPLTAAWFLLFAIPLFLFTPDTPSTGKPLGQAAREGLRQLLDTFRQIRRYVGIIRFLIARLIYTDGLATIFAYGGVYAAGVFQMETEQILMFGIALNVSAGLGAFSFAWIDDWLGSRTTILLSLVGLILPGTMILVVETQFWFWVFGLILGLFVGPVQAASRSYMAHSAPPELRNQAFGFYAFTGKIAFFCPLLVAGLTYLTDSLRVGMSAVVAFLTIGLLVMLTAPREPQ